MRDISVVYRNIEGLHVFTSPDIRGLYVASMDPREAFEEVSLGLQILMRLNCRVNVHVEPGISVNEFLSLIGADAAMAPHPAIVDAARFKFSSRQAA